jgi:phosphoglycerate dehydrogenase-like enzyme
LNIVISAATWYEDDQSRVDGFAERVRRAAEGHAVTLVPPSGDLFSALADAEVFFPFSGLTVTPEVVAAGPKLKWIHSPSAGVEHALFPSLVQRPIILTNSAGVYAVPISEHVIAMMLALSRGIPAIVLRQSERDWRGWRGDELLDSSALIVGLGGIGRRVARLCRAFEMRVLATRRRPENPDPDADRVLPPNELASALPEADWVIVCAPATAGTRHIIGAPELALMKPSARIVNIARGSLIDEPALVQALRDGRLGGAALDVFEEEPLPQGSPLWDLPNVLVSPHTSGSSPRGLERVLELFEDNLARFLAGQPLRNVVDKSEGY